MPSFTPQTKRKREEESPQSTSSTPSNTASFFGRVYSSIFKRRKSNTTSNDGNAAFFTPSPTAQTETVTNVTVQVGESTGLTPKGPMRFFSPTVTAATTAHTTAIANNGASHQHVVRFSDNVPTNAAYSNDTSGGTTATDSMKKKRLEPLIRKRVSISSTSSTKAAPTPTAMKLKLQQSTPYSSSSLSLSNTPITTASPSFQQKRKDKITPYPNSLKKKQYRKSQLLISSSFSSNKAKSKLANRRSTPYKPHHKEQRNAKAAKELFNQLYPHLNKNNENGNDNGNTNTYNHDLFGPPKQRIQIERKLGINQTGGSRILQPLPQQEDDSISQQNHDSDDNGNRQQPPMKKSRKVSFQITSPKPQTPLQSSNNNNTTTPTSIIQPYNPKPTPHHKQRKDFVQFKSSFSIRNDEGRVTLPSEMFYGNELDYTKDYETSSKGVVENELTREVMDNILYRKEMEKSGGNDMMRKLSGSDSASSATYRNQLDHVIFGSSHRVVNAYDSEENSSKGKNKAFNFMNNFSSVSGGSAKKGSSSILNQPLEKVGILKNLSSSSTTTTASASKSTPSKPEPAASGWGNMFQKFAMKPGQWKCEACLVTNEATTVECVSCQTPKPLATGNDTKTSTTMESGATASTTTSKFTFGISSVAATKADVLKEDQTKKTFTFGVTSSSSTTENKVASAPSFSFGTTTTNTTPKEEKTETPSFSFGATTTSTAPKEEKKETPSFSFGATSNNTAPKEEKKETPSFAFGSIPSKSNDESIDTQKPLGTAGFSFSGSSFGGTTNVTTSSSSGGGFSFGVDTASTKDDDVNDSKKKRKSESDSQPAFTTTNSNAGGFSFGQTNGNNAGSNSGSKFSFGGKQDNQTKQQSSEIAAAPQPSFAFDASNNSATNTTESKPAFSNNAGSSTFSFGNKQDDQTKQQSSDSATAPPPAAQPAFTFGASNNSTTEKSAFTFSAGSSSTTTAPSSNNMFGNNNDAPTASTPASGSFSFNSLSAPNEVKTNTNTFSFGNASSTNATAPTSTFGSTNTQTPSFSFGSNPSAATTAPSSGGFSFGQTSSSSTLAAPQFGGAPFSSSTQTPAPMSFGAAPLPTAVPAFGQTPAAPMTFGSSQQQQQPGLTTPAAPVSFGFGGAAAPTPVASFNTFGGGMTQASAGQAPPSGFGAPSATNPAVAGGGFSIGTGGGGKSTRGRRIVRAKRPGR